MTHKIMTMVYYSVSDTGILRKSKSELLFFYSKLFALNRMHYIQNITPLLHYITVGLNNTFSCHIL